MKKLALGAALFALVLLPFVSYGAQFKAGDEYKLRANEVVDENFYTAGGNVTLEGTVNGDVIAAGGTVYIDGTVRDDVLVGGGTVNVMGEVNGDVRVAGGNVTIGGTIRGEVVAVGGTVVLLSGARIERDATIAGGAITLDGEIVGDLMVRGGAVNAHGAVRGASDIQVDEKIMIASTAVFDGTLRYRAPQEAEIADGAALNGGVEYTEGRGHTRDAGKKAFGAILTIWFVVKLLMLLVAGWVLVWLAKPYVQELINRIHAGFGKETLRGFIVLVVTPVLAILLLVTIAGVLVGITVGVVYATLLLLAKITAGILLGSVLERAMNKSVVKPVSWMTVLIGTVALVIIQLIPFIGWIVAFVFFLAALGGWALFFYSKFRASA